MVEVSRRLLLAGGTVALGTAAAAAAAASAAALTRSPVPAPIPVPTAAPSRSPEPLPAVRFGDPVPIASIVPKTSGTVMQQVECTPAGELFMTQSLTGSGPSLYTTVVSRCAVVPSDPTPELDSMTILDGGHGLGLHIQPRDDGGHDVWLSLQGPVTQDAPDGGRLARFAYTPGVYAIEAIPGGVTYLPRFPNQQGLYQESVYNFDRAGGVAVERMYDFSTGRQEQYTLRRIDDLVAGVDRPIGRMMVPVDPPTMQGFTTVGGSLFRWVGLSNSGSGAPVAADPMALEQFDWGTGALVASTPFPTLGQDASGAWRDGAYEPEGCSVLRSADGSVSLVVGVAVGGAGDHAWPVYRLPLLA